MRAPVVIRNGTDLERYARIPPRRDDHRELRALYMGNLGRSQGLDHVVRVAARLRDAGVDVRVRLVGHGAERARLEALNRRLGSPVDIRGQVPAGEVAEHYAWADTTIVSLRPWAPFEWTVPSKLYELLASGRHVTGILGGEAAEILAECGAGHVVPPGDEDDLAALWALLAASPAELDRGERGGGREWVERHADYDALAERYLALLAETAAASGEAAGRTTRTWLRRRRAQRPETGPRPERATRTRAGTNGRSGRDRV